MSNFSSPSFDAQAYSQNRPPYPRQLYEFVSSYSQHHATLLDLGCGPGLSTFDFLPYFDHIIGIEPGEGMVKVANNLLRQKTERGEIGEGKQVRFERGRADDLGMIESGTIDLVVACTAAHYFDPKPTWLEILRVLKPGGSFLFFTYSAFHFPSRPDLENLVEPFNHEVLGPYWPEPGHTIAETLLASFPLPYTTFLPRGSDKPQGEDGSFDETSFERKFYLLNPSTIPKLLDSEQLIANNPRPPPRVTTESIILKKRWNRGELKRLIETWSGVHGFRQSSSSSSEGHGKRDCVEEFMDNCREMGWKDEEETVEIGWELGMMMGRKKS